MVQLSQEKISKIPKWNMANYQYCPFAKPSYRTKISPEDHGIVTEATIELYNLLKTQFDQTVFVLSEDFGIRLSYGLWEKALLQFLANEGYCYPGISEVNLPYIFAFFGLQQQKVYGQCVNITSPLYEDLQKCDQLTLEAGKEKGYAKVQTKQFTDLRFRITGHKRHIRKDGELYESIVFCVDEFDHFSVKQTLSECTIHFSETRFLDAIADAKKSRDQKLLDIASHYMKPLELTKA